MRVTTEVWAKFNSVGHPDSQLIYCGTVKEVMAKLIQWILEVKMGARIEITIARSESELNSNVPKKADDMMAMLESIMASESDGVPTEDDNERYVLGDSKNDMPSAKEFQQSWNKEGNR